MRKAWKTQWSPSSAAKAPRAQMAAKIKMELRAGQTVKNVPLTAKSAGKRVSLLKAYSQVVAPRYRQEQLRAVARGEKLIRSLLRDHTRKFLEPVEVTAVEAEETDDLYVMSYVDILPGLLKIGRSSKPEERRRALEASHAFRMEIVSVFPQKGHLEQEVHRRLAHCRYAHGAGTEWFVVDRRSALETILAALNDFTTARPPRGGGGPRSGA